MPYLPSVWRVCRVLKPVAALFCCCLLPVLSAWAADQAAVPDFSPEEKAFIEAHPLITYSDSDWRPLSILENGQIQGLFHDYLGLISQRTGLAFRFEPQGDGRDSSSFSMPCASGAST